MKKLTKAILSKRAKRQAKREFKQKLAQWKEQIIARDSNTCQKCHRRLGIVNNFGRHPHHIVALQAVKRNYPSLLTDINNGILLCGYCHKWAPDSPHQGSFEFVLWLKHNRPEQYDYLYNKLESLRFTICKLLK